MTTQEMTRTEQESQSLEGTRNGNYFTPTVDIYEEGDKLVLLADMPGVARDRVSINLEKGVLTIEGHTDNLEPRGSVVVSEFERGNYLRRFNLSDSFQHDKISASFDNGVLCVELPKSEAMKPRKIAVQIG